MELTNRVTNKFLGLILILCLTRASHGKLMCYVCDDCAQITAQTPQFECNEDFFNTSGPTDSSVQTTTEHSKTTETMTEETTSTAAETTSTISTMSTEETTITSTTEAKTPESTNKFSTENVTETAIESLTEPTTSKAKDTTTTISTQRSTSTTEQQPPTPPTIGTPRTTTSVPTPPYFDIEEALDDVDSLNNRTVAHEQDVNQDEVENVDITNATTKLYKPSAEIRVRQQRSVSDVTFHCFKVEATKVNGTMVVNRGCSRVQTSESVCDQWKAQHTNEKLKKCYPCSRTKCNGSSALNVSITALFVAVVAFLMHRK